MDRGVYAGLFGPAYGSYESSPSVCQTKVLVFLSDFSQQVGLFQLLKSGKAGFSRENLNLGTENQGAAMNYSPWGSKGEGLRDRPQIICFM